MLYNGEKIGDGTPPLTDIAVDPIDGTTLTAQGRGGALAVIAVAERGAMFDPGPCVYMEKLAVGPQGQGRLRHPPHADREPPRPFRGAGPSRPRPDGRHPRPAPPRRPGGRGAGHRADPAHLRRRHRGGHRHRVAWGRDRHPPGNRGHARGRHRRSGPEVYRRRAPGTALPRNERERAIAAEAGYALDAVLTTDDLVQGNNCFFAATGHHRRRAAPGRAVPRNSELPRSRWSCAPSRGRCARSTPATPWPSWRSTAPSRSARHAAAAAGPAAGNV